VPGAELSDPGGQVRGGGPGVMRRVARWSGAVTWWGVVLTRVDR
jgi:hypothetical protein